MARIPSGSSISSRSTAAEALRNTIDLARQAERFGYARYWYAEHHLNPGVDGTSAAVMLALTASATSTIRLGFGAVQLGHRTALSTVEEFGLIDTLHPGRLDLGLGRSGGRPTGRFGESSPTPRFPWSTDEPPRAENPAEVFLRAPARLTSDRTPATAAATNGCPATGLRRADRRHPRAAAGYVPVR
ncbi:LLM class flavin-dependent oxidoreductase [Streptomyces sp. NPDC057580]|uniref:LLM class flavin-dependent oxidoreductase n=1 Tax=Streptomyces sp. NPDC057580 TaxID=3346173 RepID=UPI0036C785F6